MHPVTPLAFDPSRAVSNQNLPGLVEDGGLFFRVEPLPENIEDRDYSYFEHLPQKAFLMSADKAEKQAFLKFRREKYGEEFLLTEEEKQEKVQRKHRKDSSRFCPYLQKGYSRTSNIIHQLMLYFQIFRFLEKKKMQNNITSLERKAIEQCERVKKRLENRRHMDEWRRMRDQYFTQIT